MGMQCIRSLHSKMKLQLAAVVVPYLLALAVAQEEDHLPRPKLIGGVLTRTRFTTIASTTFSSCLTVLGATTECQGRKRRDLLKKLRSVGQALEGTQDDDSVVLGALDSSKNLDDREGKLFVAVSLTSFTTIITTAFMENTSAVVSISFACVPPDGININFCG